MPSSIGGIISGASAILGALGAGDAADAQAAAQAQGIKIQKEMYDQTRKDLGPYRDIGGAGAYTLAQLLGLYNPYATTSSNTILGGAPAAASANASAGAGGGGGQGRNPAWTARDLTKSWDVGQYYVPGNGNREKVMTPYGKVTYDAKTGKVYSGSQTAKAWYLSNGGGGSASANANATGLGPNGETAPDNFGMLLRRFKDEDWTTDPGYQFRRDEGEKSINRSLAAQGGLLSGAAVKAGQRFNQDLASAEYSKAYDRDTTDKTNIYNRLMGVANMGQNAAAQQASSNQTNANALGQYQSNIGDARANGAVNQSYFANQGLQNIFGGSQYNGGLYGGGQTNTGGPYGTINWYPRSGGGLGDIWEL